MRLARNSSLTVAISFFRDSKRQSNPQLYFTFCIGCGKTQRLAGRERSSTVNIERWSKRRADNVVDAGVVGAICDVESFRGEVQAVLVAESECPAQTHIEIRIVGSQAGVARRRRRAIVGKVTVAIDVGPGEQIERVSAVVAEDGRKLKTRKPARIVPRALQRGRQRQLYGVDRSLTRRAPRGGSPGRRPSNRC